MLPTYNDWRNYFMEKQIPNRKIEHLAVNLWWWNTLFRTGVYDYRAKLASYAITRLMTEPCSQFSAETTPSQYKRQTTQKSGQK